MHGPGPMGAPCGPAAEGLKWMVVSLFGRRAANQTRSYLAPTIRLIVDFSRYFYDAARVCGPNEVQSSSYKLQGESKV